MTIRERHQQEIEQSALAGMQMGRQEGMQLGRQEGVHEGMEKAVKAVVKNMLTNQKVSIEMIASFTELSVAEVKQIENELASEKH